MKTLACFFGVALLLLSLGCIARKNKLSDKVMKIEVSKRDDFSTLVSAALKKCKKNGIDVLEIPSGEFLVSSTINLVDDITIRGNSTVLEARFVPTGRGGHPVTIFDTPPEGVENVTLQKLIFRGVAKGRRKNLSLTEKPANTLRLRNSQNVTLRDCEIREHYSNIPAPFTPENFEEVRKCVGLSIDNCQNVFLDNVRMIDMRNEALWAYRSRNVVIKNMFSLSERGLSTHLSFWYCDTVLVEGGRFEYLSGGGSTINCESSNVVIRKNTFINGRGIDISNEGKFEDFSPVNIEVSDNVLENAHFYGIMRNRSQAVLTNFVVRNNQVSISEDTGKRQGVKLFGIKTDDTRNATVEGNTITFNGREKKNDHIAFGSVGFQEVNTVIRNNKVYNADFLYWGSTYVGDKDNILIEKNECTMRPSKASVMIYNHDRAKPGHILRSFVMLDNKLFGDLPEELLVIDSKVGMQVDGLRVSGNDHRSGSPLDVELSGEGIEVTGDISLGQKNNKTMLKLKNVSLPEASRKALVGKTIVER